jgi:serine/threonine protein kinase
MGNKQENGGRGRRSKRDRKTRQSLRLSRSTGDIDDSNTRATVGFLSPQRIMRTSPRSPRQSEVEINWNKIIDSSTTTTVVEGNMDAIQRKSVVIKIFNGITDDHALKELAEHEFDIASGLECDYIVDYIDIRMQNDNYYITMEKCDMDLHDLLTTRHKPLEIDEFGILDPADLLNPTDLVDRIKRDSYQYYPLSEPELKQLATHILRALDYLHGIGILHLDVKLPNIFVKNGPPISQSTVFKLGDFGLSKHKSQMCKPRNYGGTVEYAPPEVLCRKTYSPSEKHDIWSFGLCLFICATMMMPIGVEYGKDNVVLNWETVRHDALHIPMTMLDSLSDPAYDFISFCLMTNPKTRPKAQWLLNASNWLHEDPLVTYSSIVKKD